METEIWVPVINYEGLYEVSNFGRVKSLPKVWYGGKGMTTKNFHNGKILQPCKKNVYAILSLRKNQESKTFRVHRLVYESFNGKTNLHIDHIIEGDKFNNNLSNLQAIDNRANRIKSNLTKKSSSKFIGVCWVKRRNKWQAAISINNQNIFLGYFLLEQDAANAYLKKYNELYEKLD